MKTLLLTFAAALLCGQAPVRNNSFLPDKDYDTLAHACTAAGTTTLAITKAWTDVPSRTLTCPLLFLGNGIIQPAFGQTVTLAGPIVASLVAIFDDSAGGRIVVSKQTPAYPEWWGAIADDSTDNATAISNAIAGARNITFAGTTAAYRINRAIAITTPVQINLLAGVTISGMLAPHGGALLGLLQFNSGSEGSTVTGAGYTSVITWRNGVPNYSNLINIRAESVALRNFRVAGNGNSAVKGEFSGNIALDTGSSHFSADGIWSDTAQGDGIQGASTVAPGCVDWSVTNSHFTNLGRSFIVVAGYGCDRVRIRGNDFETGTLVTGTTTTSHGAFIDFEPDFPTASSELSVVEGNSLHNIYTSGISYSFHSAGLRVFGNTSTIRHSNRNQAACYGLVDAVGALISGNSCTGVTGDGTVGESGIYVAPFTAGYNHEIQVSDNVVEGVSGPCYSLQVNIPARAGSSAQFHHNIARGCGDGGFAFGGHGYGGTSLLTVDSNEAYGVTGAAFHLEGVGRYVFTRNHAVQYTTTGADLTTNINFPKFGPGEVFDNILTNDKVSGQVGLTVDPVAANYSNRFRRNTLTGNSHALGGAGIGDASNVFEVP